MFGCATSSPGLLDAEAAARVEAQLIQINEKIYGTVEQNRRLEEMTYFAFQLPFQDCLAGQGYEYAPPPIQSSLVGHTTTRLPGFYSSFAPITLDPLPEHPLNVAAFVSASSLQTQATLDHKNPGYESLSVEEKGKYEEQAFSCQPDPATYNIGEDVVNQELLAAFEELLAIGESAAAEDGSLKRYPKCMRDHGLAVDASLNTDDLGPIVAVATVLVRPMLELQTKAGANDPNFEQTARDTQALIMKADSDCRSKAHDIAISRVAPLLPDFFDEWESELNKSAAAYEELTKVSG
jgi:hypothetical protein